MTARIAFESLNKDAFQKLYAFSSVLKKTSIESSLHHLVNIRASQVNGCAFCVDMHIKEAKIDGERELRLYHVGIWRESTLFSERERAALEWTELLTKLPEHGVSDEAFARAREQFSEVELNDLTYCIISINGWNRISIGFKNVPGSRDEAYGLMKVGLS